MATFGHSAFDIAVEHVLSYLKLDRTFCLKSEQLEAVRQLSQGQLDVLYGFLLDLANLFATRCSLRV